MNHTAPARIADQPADPHDPAQPAAQRGPGAARRGQELQAIKPAEPSSDSVAARCSALTNAMLVSRPLIQGFTVKVKWPSVLWVSTEVTCHSTL